ncbi:hypothetical protein CNP60_15625 [Salmonella enterica]|nr:hypothetical protein [Salmonella enterica]
MRRLSSPGNITEWKTSFCAMRALGDHDRKNDLRGNKSRRAASGGATRQRVAPHCCRINAAARMGYFA